MHSLRFIAVAFTFLMIAPPGESAEPGEAQPQNPAPPQGVNGREPKTETETFAELDLEMVWIPGGTFRMNSRPSPEEVARRYGGRKESFENEHPLHEVTLDGFWMGKFEVTNAQFRRFKPDHHSGAIEGLSLNGDDQPVCEITWEEATAFCDWLTENTDHTYRLPTEAEWEYACRAGTETVRFWGDDDPDIGRYANVLDESAATVFGPAIRSREENVPGVDPFIATKDGFVVSAPVGSFKPNAFGLHDTIGNAIEYCLDWHDPAYYQHSPARNPINLTPAEHRVSRGGSWLHPSFRQRAALRGSVPMSHRSARVGFRLCRERAAE